MIRILTIIAALLFAIGLYAAPVDDLIKDGKLKYSEGNTGAAIMILEQAVSMDPSSIQAKKELADVYTDMGDMEYGRRNFKNAFDYYKKAVKLYPSHTAAGAKYWKMKQDFTPDSLKNEGPLAGDKESAREKDVEVLKGRLLEEKAKELKDVFKEDNKAYKAAGKKTKEPVLDDEYYKKRIIEIEAKFDRKLAEITKQRQKEEGLFQFKNKFELFSIMGIVIIISLIIGTIVFFVLSSNLKLRKKSRKGKSAEEIGISITRTPYYKELIKMQNMEELIENINTGELDWEVVKKNISEIDKQIRMEILTLIENKIEREKQPVNSGQSEVLMCLLLDGDEYIRKRASLILKRNLADAESQQSRAALPFLSKQLQLPLSMPQSSSMSSQAPDQKLLGSSFDIEDLNIVIPLSKLVDRKVYRADHSLRVATNSYNLALAMGLTPEECKLIYIAAIIHDIGYLDVPSEILNKKKALTAKEMETIQKHTIRGAELLDFINLPEIVSNGILYHHEKWDGGGYPEGLEKEKIPMVARIITIVDVYEAMISPRPYRPPFSSKEAISKVNVGSGIFFDPKIVEIFNQLVEKNITA